MTVVTGLDLLHFALPAELSATRPPEARGLQRDEVRLLVSDGGVVSHARFWELGEHLRRGDVLVINQSATVPSAVDGLMSGSAVTVHLSTPLDDGMWVVELRQPDGSGPILDALPGSEVAAPGGVISLIAPHHRWSWIGVDGEPVRLWRARVAPSEGAVLDWLQREGRPITYGYVDGRWPIAAYQTVFGQIPGSAEMPSASRPFSDQVVRDLAARGIVFAPIVLHTGVSSLEAHEPPQAERYEVPATSARIINEAKASRRRIIAVGTTATRAVETVTDVRGVVHAGGGWTELVLGGGNPVRAVDGIITGWHEPGASHLHLLEAVAGADVVAAAYASALDEGYLWHEFGDSALLMRPSL